MFEYAEEDQECYDDCDCDDCAEFFPVVELADEAALIEVLLRSLDRVRTNSMGHPAELREVLIKTYGDALLERVAQYVAQ